MRKTISVSGARANNLKNIDVEIPRDLLTVVTGVSGSGKSSLVYDVIFGEAQRKFLESMSSYGRSRVAIMDKADVDSVQGLSPVVAIQQRRGIRNPRSTVGTITEISNYLRLLYATIGLAHCPYCNEEISTKSASYIAERMQSLPDGTKIELLAPTFKIHGEDYEYLFDDIRRQGFKNVYINDVLHDLSDSVEIDEAEEYKMDVLIDKFTIKRNIYKLLLRAVENAINIGHGLIQIEITNKDDFQEKSVQNYHSDVTCPNHHILMSEQMNFHFSFNNPQGACITCGGIGTTLVAKPFLIVNDPKKSIKQGALDVNWAFPVEGLAAHYGFSLETPFSELSDKVKDVIFYGTKGEKFEHKDSKRYKSEYMRRNIGKMITFNGIINNMNRSYRSATKRGKITIENVNWYRKHMAELICPDCLGKKLRQEKLLVTINDLSIHELGELSLKRINDFLNNLELPKDKEIHVKLIIRELTTRLSLLLDIGLEYLSINRKSETLSGGEEQRIRLSTQIGSELMGMLYVLDEPSIGLHQKDVTKVIKTLKKLRDIGNTVIVVEHDLETISEADHIIEMGPGPGIHGGKISAQGQLSNLNSSAFFITGDYLFSKKKIILPKKRRKIRLLKVGYVPQVLICSSVVSQSGHDNGIVKLNLFDSKLDS